MNHRRLVMDADEKKENCRRDFFHFACCKGKRLLRILTSITDNMKFTLDDNFPAQESLYNAMMGWTKSTLDPPEQEGGEGLSRDTCQQYQTWRNRSPVGGDWGEKERIIIICITVELWRPSHGPGPHCASSVWTQNPVSVPYSPDGWILEVKQRGPESSAEQRSLERTLHLILHSFVVKAHLRKGVGFGPTLNMWSVF